MKSRAATRAFTTRVRVLRSPSIDTSTAVRGQPLVVYESIFISAIDPAAQDTTNRLVLENPINLFEAYADIDLDIRNGDTVYVHDTQETYVVRNPFKWPGSHILLVLEFVRSHG